MTTVERDNKGRLKPGSVLNPVGRVKGTRNRLSRDFIDALSADFRQHGAKAISKVRRENPAKYLEICARMVPQEQHHIVEHGMETMSDEDLQARLNALLDKSKLINGLTVEPIKTVEPLTVEPVEDLPAE